MAGKCENECGNVLNSKPLFRSVSYLNGQTLNGLFCGDCVYKTSMTCCPIVIREQNPLIIVLKYKRPTVYELSTWFPACISQIVIDYYANAIEENPYYGMDDLIMNRLLRTLYVCESAGLARGKATSLVSVEKFYLSLPTVVKAWLPFKNWEEWFEVEPFDPLSLQIEDELVKSIKKLKQKRKQLKAEMSVLNQDILNKKWMIQERNNSLDQRAMYAKWLEWRPK